MLRTHRGVRASKPQTWVEDLLTVPHSHLGVSSFAPCCLLSVPLIEGQRFKYEERQSPRGPKGKRKGDRGGNEPPLTLPWNQDRGEMMGYVSPRFPWNLCLRMMIKTHCFGFVL